MAALSAREIEDFKPTAGEECPSPKQRAHLPGDDTFDESSDSGQGNTFDKSDMRRMGKEQQFRRKFELASTIGFTSCVMSTWEIFLTTSSTALTNGGLAGTFWLLVSACCGHFFVVLSLAELASAAPTAGAQYHWVSEYAPKHLQKILSFCSGCLSTIL